MGISGLLPLLKEAQEPIHVSKYKGKTVGIDAYVWLHRGAYGCAEALALDKPTQSYINYAMTKVRMLQHYGVRPYLVFDGGHLPAKQKTEEERAQRRQQSIARARELVAKGRRKEAREHYTRCIDVTPEMAYQLIKALRAAGVPYIVAAYEADAQLAYLERTNVIDAIITEDSDLLVFGCKTVLYKLDGEGHCMELNRERRHLCTTLNLQSFSDDLFRQMAILSGCDYLASIPGLGLKKSFILLKKYHTVARVLAAVRMDGMRVPDGYQEAFSRAERTFVYQRVFCKKSDGSVRLVTLTESPSADAIGDSDDFVGPVIPQDLAAAIASGDVNPITRQPIIDLTPSSPIATSNANRTAVARQTSSGSFYRQGSRSKASPPKLEAGQRGLHSFFSRSTSNSTASVTIPRHPLLDKTNETSKSSSHLDVLKLEAGMAGVQDSPMIVGSSKYFDNSKAHGVGLDSQAIVATPSRKTPTFAVQLASFSPLERTKRSSSHASSDGDVISSPASARKSDRVGDALDTSPQMDDIFASSPCTSPTNDTTVSIPISASTSDSSSKNRKRVAGQVPLVESEEDAETCFDVPFETKQLFEKWRFETPKAGALATRDILTTTRKSLIDSPLLGSSARVVKASTGRSVLGETNVNIPKLAKTCSSPSLCHEAAELSGPPKIARRASPLPVNTDLTMLTPSSENKFAAFAFSRNAARQASQTPVAKRSAQEQISSRPSSTRRLQLG